MQFRQLYDMLDFRKKLKPELILTVMSRSVQDTSTLKQRFNFDMDHGIEGNLPYGKGRFVQD